MSERSNLKWWAILACLVSVVALIVVLRTLQHGRFAADSGGTLETSCDDSIDNDADGLVDCEDPDCDEDPACHSTSSSSTATIETTCNDSIDNDADGLVDCEDPDCDADPNCAGSSSS